MRILAITNLYPNPYQPHLATFNRQQFRVLAGLHPLTVIAPILWTDELAARRRGASPMPEGRCVVHDGIEVFHPRYLYTPKMFRDWYGHFFRLSVRWAFRRAVEEFRPDLVYGTWAYPDGWAAVELGREAGLPVVIKVHGSDVLSLPAFPRRRRQTTEALRQADGVIAVSRDLAKEVIALGADPARVRIVYNGVDTGRFRPGSSAEARSRLGLSVDGPVVLAVANLEPVKGLDVLVGACERMARDGVRFTCHVIGGGPLRDRLGQQIERAGLPGRVVLHGRRPHDSLPDWYRAADVVVLPSLSEGVPNVLLEAAACGVPFVASRVGGIPEIAHLGGNLGGNRLVPPGDVGCLADALRECLENRGWAPPPTAYARSHEEAVAELGDLFERVLRGLPFLDALRPTIPHQTEDRQR